MFFGEEDSPFHNLPSEMVVEVLSFVNLEGKKNARLVSRRWRWILDHPNSGLLCFKKGGEIDSMKYILNSQLHIENLILLDIKMTWPSMTYSRNKFPPIREIYFHQGNSEQTVTTILQYGCTETEHLTLDRLSLGLVRPDILSRLLSGLKWNQLNTLFLVVAPEITESSIGSNNWDKHYIKSLQNHANGILQILRKAAIPNLRNLKLLVCPYEENEISAGFIKLMSEFLTFIERHSKTLKELGFFVFFRSNDERFASTFSNIPTPIFSADQQESISRNLNLETFETSASHFDIITHLVPQFVWKSDKLTKLIWCPIKHFNGLMAKTGSANPIQSLIERNGNTLTNVKATFINGDITVDPFQINWLESCPALREVTIDNFDKILEIKVQLSSVTKLDTGHSIHYGNIRNVSGWIARSFQNLETVKFAFWIQRIDRYLELDWVQDLLILPRLRQILLSVFFLPSGSDDNFLNMIRQYCDVNPTLTFKTGRKREARNQFMNQESGIIKIHPLPQRNIN